MPWLGLTLRLKAMFQPFARLGVAKDDFVRLFHLLEEWLWYGSIGFYEGATGQDEVLPVCMLTSFNEVPHDSLKKVFLLVLAFVLMPEFVHIIGAAKGKKWFWRSIFYPEKHGQDFVLARGTHCPVDQIALAIRRIKDPLTFNSTAGGGISFILVKLQRTASR